MILLSIKMKARITRMTHDLIAQRDSILPSHLVLKYSPWPLSQASFLFSESFHLPYCFLCVECSFLTYLYI